MKKKSQKLTASLEKTMDYKNILIIVVIVRERFIGLKYNNNENKYPL